MSKTKIGRFLAKVGGSFPDVLELGIDLITGDIEGVVDNVKDILLGNKKKASDSGNSQLEAMADKFLAELERDKIKYAVDLASIDLKNTNSAREREVALAKLGKFDFMFNFAGVVGIGIFVFIVYALVYVDIPESKEKLFYHLLGIIEGIVLMEYNYIFGSSRDKSNR